MFERNDESQWRDLTVEDAVRGTATNRVKIPHHAWVTGQFVVGTLKSVVAVAACQGKEQRINKESHTQCFMSEARIATEKIMDHTLRINGNNYIMTNTIGSQQQIKY